MHAFALSLLVFAAAPTLPAKANPGTWQLLYTVTRPDQWLTAVWSRKDGTWYAGGKNVLVVGKDASVKTTDLPQAVLYKFGEDSAMRVVAVGSGQRIWEQDGDGLRLVHEKASTLTGRASYGDILYGVGYLDPASAETLIAYGPNDLIGFRGAGGAWETKRDSSLSRRAQMGPPDIHLPAKCQRLTWRWLARDQGFLACHNGDSYFFGGGTMAAAGRLQDACRTDMNAISRDGEDIYASCGTGQTVLATTVASRSWTRVEGAPAGVRGLGARDGCLMAVTDRNVWRRRCDAAFAKSTDQRGGSTDARCSSARATVVDSAHNGVRPGPS